MSNKIQHFFEKGKQVLGISFENANQIRPNIFLFKNNNKKQVGVEDLNQCISHKRELRNIIKVQCSKHIFLK